MPKVSVIIPTYNAMTYISETVGSVLSQTFTDFELLIIDDGSSDGTVQWASQIVDPRVKLISQPNHGKPFTNNRGIAHTQGDYIAFLDHDDLWEPTKLEKQVRCLEDNPAIGLVDTWLFVADAQGNPRNKVTTSRAEGKVWKQMIEFNSICCGSTPMVRRCCFETVGGFDEKLFPCEDWDMWIRIASRYPFAVVKEPLARWRQHSNNTSNNWKRMFQACLMVVEKTFQSAPSEFLYLKSCSVGRVHLYIAWRALISHDYEQASYFRQQALAHYPRLLYSESYIRLGLFLVGKQWLSPRLYSGARTLFHALRKQFKLLKATFTNLTAFSKG